MSCDPLLSKEFAETQHDETPLWACKHKLSEHTREEARLCLLSIAAASHAEGGASAPPAAGPQPAPSIDTEAEISECTCPLEERPTHCQHKYALSDCWIEALTPSAGLVTAEQFCTEAARLVGGPRAATHGDKSINFANIAELWNGYWRIKCRVSGEKLSTPFTAYDIGCMMELLKIARRFSGSFNADDYVDAAGYAGCTGEIAAAKESQRNA